MNNNWYSENAAKNPSLKLNISMLLQLIVTKGLTGPISLNYLSPQPVHTPLKSSASLTRVSRESVLRPVTVSTSTLPLQGDSSLTETWPMSGERGCNPLWWPSASNPRPCSILIPGDRSCTHPLTCWPLGREGREMQSSPQRLQWGEQGHHQGESQQTGHGS